MPPVGFELTIPASARPQTYALDGEATGFDESTRLYTGLSFIQVICEGISPEILINLSAEGC
jgi:hypothetical protein